jgi:hypothetical protein
LNPAELIPKSQEFFLFLSITMAPNADIATRALIVAFRSPLGGKSLAKIASRTLRHSPPTFTSVIKSKYNNIELHDTAVHHNAAQPIAAMSTLVSSRASFTQASQVITLVEDITAGKYINLQPWTESQLAPGEYYEILPRLKPDIENKLQYVERTKRV